MPAPAAGLAAPGYAGAMFTGFAAVCAWAWLEADESPLPDGIAEAIMVVDRVPARWRTSSEPLALAVFAATAGAAAVYTVGGMMLWESYGFTPAAIAWLIAFAGLLTAAAGAVTRRLTVHRRSARGWAFVGSTLSTLGIIGLLNGPSRQSRPAVIAAALVAAAGAGCLRAAMAAIATRSPESGAPHNAVTARDGLRAIACVVGPVSSASVFYSHERTSFAIGALLTAAAGVWATVPRGQDCP